MYNEITLLLLATAVLGVIALAVLGWFTVRRWLED
jgi:UPF0716 family protein affecting phage T7 exclusion